MEKKQLDVINIGGVGEVEKKSGKGVCCCFAEEREKSGDFNALVKFGAADEE